MDIKTAPFHGPFGDHELTVTVCSYAVNKRLAVNLLHKEDGFFLPFAALTVNLPKVPLQANEAFIKDFDENAGLLDFVLENQLAFDIKPIEINRYDRLTRQLIEEYAGTVSLGGGGSIDGGFSADLLLDYDRGYASGSINFYGDEVLDARKAAAFLCADCLNELLPQEIEPCFGVGAIDLSTKEIRVFEESLGGFGLGDFHIDCDLKDLEDGSRQMSILIFYCPIRYAILKPL